MAIGGFASRPSRSLFIFPTGLRASRQRVCTICITSQPSTERIGQAKERLRHGKSRAAAAGITQPGLLIFVGSEAGSSLYPSGGFMCFLAEAPPQKNFI